MLRRAPSLYHELRERPQLGVMPDAAIPPTFLQNDQSTRRLQRTSQLTIA